MNTWIQLKLYTQSLFYHRLLTISCYVLNTVLKLKTSIDVWTGWLWSVWLVVSASHGLMGAVPCCHTPASQQSVLWHIASWGKIKIQNLNKVSNEHILLSNHHKVEKLQVEPLCLWDHLYTYTEKYLLLKVSSFNCRVLVECRICWGGLQVRLRKELQFKFKG